MAETLADLGKSSRERYGAPPRERWAPDRSDAAFVASKRAQGAGWNAIAAMLGKPVADVRARFDKGFDKAFAYDRAKPAPPPPIAKKSQTGRTRAGKPRGDVTVAVLELLRDGFVTSKAIGGQIGRDSDRVSSQLGYCLLNGWATAARVKGAGLYAITPAGLAKIKAHREACDA